MTYIAQVVVNALSVGGLYAIIALGVAMVFSVMKLINFAHSSLLMASAYALLLCAFTGWWAMLPFALVAAIALALLMERIVFRPLRGADVTILLVASFAVSEVLQGAAQMLAGTRPIGVPLPPWLSSSITAGGVSVSVLSVVTVVATGLSLVALALVMRGTRLGIHMRAAAEDLPMARLLGVSPSKVVVTTFVLSGALAAVAAILITSQLGTVDPGFGFTYVIGAFIACVIGGMGSLVGAAVGGVVLGGLTSILQAVLPAPLTGYRDAIVYLVVILLLIWRPQGLFGKVGRLV